MPFQQGPVRVFRAPGRVNLIGEHTDYNGGFVMPVAIDRETRVLCTPRGDRQIEVISRHYGETVRFSIDEAAPTAARHWSDYVRGVSVILQDAGFRLCGTNLLIDQTVPIGSGLSSSAAIEVAAARALLGNAGLEVDPVRLASLCQRAENEFVGARCGIMDQFIACCGRAGHALLLDCRSLEYRHLRLPEECALVISNTMVRHEVASGEYNARREQCELGVRQIAGDRSEIGSLRDIGMAELERSSQRLDPVVYRRCRHVVGEIGRVLKATEALERRDLEAFGRLMYESHRSLRDDYEVSCPELDLMVELARRVDGVYGSRMTGAGFGGCTISLVQSGRADVFRETLASEYRKATGIEPAIYVGSAMDGASEEAANV